MANPYSGTKSLISGTYRVEVPFIKVTIGNNTFGVFEKKKGVVNNEGFYTKVGIQYPNYIQSLSIDKVNGKVNKYNLSLEYPIRPGDDPNFFEKIISTRSKDRKIIFSYGDLSAPDYIYKNEQAIITDIKTDIDSRSSKLSYTIEAVSNSIQSPTSRSIWKAPSEKVQPSKLIKDLLKDQSNGLVGLFWGMANVDLVEQLGLIRSDDQEVHLETQINMTVLDYVRYLVANMIPKGSIDGAKVRDFYALTIHDESENEQINRTSARNLGGPYFKVTRVSKNIEHSDAYTVDVGYPGGAFVTSFRIENNQNYSLYYNYNDSLTSNEYVTRIDDDGNIIKEYAPVATSINDHFSTRASDKVWWAKVTEYPINAVMEIRGLLKPALLMDYVRVNVIFYGHKHIASGLYIITRQTDSISRSGYKTTLSLTRVSGESEEDFQ